MEECKDDEAALEMRCMGRTTTTVRNAFYEKRPLLDTAVPVVLVHVTMQMYGALPAGSLVLPARGTAAKRRVGSGMEGEGVATLGARPLAVARM